MIWQDVMSGSEWIWKWIWNELEMNTVSGNIVFSGVKVSESVLSKLNLGAHSRDFCVIWLMFHESCHRKSGQIRENVKWLKCRRKVSEFWQVGPTWKFYHSSGSTWWFLQSAISKSHGKFSEVREKSGNMKIEKVATLCKSLKSMESGCGRRF